MKIRFSPLSPFARRVMVRAAELGLEIERLPSAAGPVARDQAIIADNPVGRVPPLVADETARCSTTAGSSASTWTRRPAANSSRRLGRSTGALVQEALGNDLLGAGQLIRHETILRPAENWKSGQMDKVRCALDRMDGWAPTLGDQPHVGTITLGCARGCLFPLLRPWLAP